MKQTLHRFPDGSVSVRFGDAPVQTLVRLSGSLVRRIVRLSQRKRK